MNPFRRIRRWFLEKYLPAYVRESYREDIAALRATVKRHEVTIAQQQAYISGLEYGYRAMRRININTGGGG